jgi:hypothetical protein
VPSGQPHSTPDSGAQAGRDLFRQLKSGPDRAIGGAGASALVAMLVAGLFEYNFGDSEFLMLFLIVATLPFTTERREGLKSEV